MEKVDVEIERQTVEDSPASGGPEGPPHQGADRSPWQTSFVIRLDLGQGLTKRERAILLRVARHCEVHKLLAGQIRWDYGWAEGDA